MGWTYNIGDFTFHVATGRLRRCDDAGKGYLLSDNESRLFAFMIEHYGNESRKKEYKEQMIRAVWRDERRTDYALTKVFQSLRKQFGPRESEYFASRPYRLRKEPVPKREAEASPEGVWLDKNTRTPLFSPSKYVPIGEADLTANIGKFRRHELPTTALEELTIQRPELIMDAKVYQFLRDVLSSPKKYHDLLSKSPTLRQWVNTISSTTDRGSKNRERQQLLKFVRAMFAPNPGTELLPWFGYDDTSCWRIFVQLFPESIVLLEQVSVQKDLPNRQRMAIAQLCATLATTNDGQLSSRAAAIAKRLRDEVSVTTCKNYREYQLTRQFLYTAVEAGIFPAEKMIDFLHRHEATGWDRRLNREYYKDSTDESSARSTVKKSLLPLRRDENSKPITDYFREILPRELIDEAYKHFRARRKN